MITIHLTFECEPTGHFVFSQFEVPGTNTKACLCTAAFSTLHRPCMPETYFPELPHISCEFSRILPRITCEFYFPGFSFQCVPPFILILLAVRQTCDFQIIRKRCQKIYLHQLRIFHHCMCTIMQYYYKDQLDGTAIFLCPKA